MFKDFDPIRFPLPEFVPQVFFFTETKTLVYLSEDMTYVAVRVTEVFDILRHGYEPRYIGIEIWIGYDPQLLLAD